MRDPVESLVLDLLEWIGTGSKPYQDVIEVWRTSCPRLPVWEEANARGYIAHTHRPGGVAQIALSVAGLARLRAQRQVQMSQIMANS